MSDRRSLDRPRRQGSLAELISEPGPRVLHVTVVILNAVLRLFTRHVWLQQEKVPQQGGVIFVPNHISNVDPLVIGQFVAYSGRWPRYLAKDSLFRVPLLGRLLRACGQIPVQRNTAAAAGAVAAAVAAVEQGQAVIVYPEGTITYDEELWPMVGRTGAARIALSTGCPVVPIGQWGAQELMYGKRIHFPKLLPRKTVRVIAGDPVPLDDLRGQPVTGAVLTEATDRIMTAITALVAELRGEPAPATRYDPRRSRPVEGSP